MENVSSNRKVFETQCKAEVDQALDKFATRMADIDKGVESTEKMLKTFYDKLIDSRIDFREGDIVEWKTGLKNKRYPDYGMPAIVVELLGEPLYDNTRDSGSSYFREPLDCVLGLFGDDGDFVTFYFDSRRFRKYVSLSSEA